MSRRSRFARLARLHPFRAVLVILLASAGTLAVSVPAASAQSASIAQSCFKDNGRFDIELSNPIGAPRAIFEVEVTGLPKRSRVLFGGGSTTVTVTGRKDGIYNVKATAAGSVIEDRQFTVACDPEVQVKVSCLQSNGRIDVNINNNRSSAFTYRVTITGLSPRSRVVPANTDDRVTVTGRPDRSYGVKVERDGSQIFFEDFAVSCDSDGPQVPLDENSVIVTCSAGFGRFDVTTYFAPDAALPGAMYFELKTGKIRPRTAVLTQGSTFQETITGRNDGDHTITVRANGAIYFSKDVVVDC